MKELWAIVLFGGLAGITLLLPLPLALVFGACYTITLLTGVHLLHGRTQYDISRFETWTDAPAWFATLLSTLYTTLVALLLGLVLSDLLSTDTMPMLIVWMLLGLWFGFTWGYGGTRAYQHWLHDGYSNLREKLLRRAAQSSPDNARRPETLPERGLCWQGDLIVPCAQQPEHTCASCAACAAYIEQHSCAVCHARMATGDDLRCDTCRAATLSRCPTCDGRFEQETERGIWLEIRW